MFCHPRPAGTNIFCSISTKNIPDWSGVEVRRSWRIEKSLEDGIFFSGAWGTKFVLHQGKRF